MILKRYALALVLAALLGGVRAADEVTMSAAQATALGVETAPLQARSGAEIAALPAQVVVPETLRFSGGPRSGPAVATGCYAASLDTSASLVWPPFRN